MSTKELLELRRIRRVFLSPHEVKRHLGGLGVSEPLADLSSVLVVLGERTPGKGQSQQDGSGTHALTIPRGSRHWPLRPTSGPSVNRT